MSTPVSPPIPIWVANCDDCGRAPGSVLIGTRWLCAACSEPNEPCDLCGENTHGKGGHALIVEPGDDPLWVCEGCYCAAEVGIL